MRTVLLPIVLATSLALTACNQPKSESQNANVASTPASATMPMNHTQMNHDGMNHDQMNMASATASSTAGQPPHIMAYMDSMSKMHDDMAQGVAAKNADVAFAKGMIPHHQGAVAMAEIELQYGKDAEMKALAQNIIDAQQGEIKQMQDWLANNEAKLPATDNADEITQAHKANMMKNHDGMMQGIMDSDPDVAFVKGMIPHHQGAIDMSDVEQKYGKDSEMLKLAEQIKQAQTPEIKQMQDWLAKKGVK